ncbi:MAG: exosortase family protein XrtF [Bacteroidetes bacterium]|nr:exosortase family protein XrtF [Bacteroidota bacterium]MBI3481955.1 exosortase family protein XrtF [Bacteroidota bacterium]
MKLDLEFIKENKKAIRFLLVFAGLYLVLNTVYGFFIQHYYPTSDPFTKAVSLQVSWILSFFDPSVTVYPSGYSEYIAIANDRQNMIYVFEGCNGLNVLIVYISFLVAFKGPQRLLLQFTGMGIVGIHLLNLARVVLLYAVAFYFPEQLYFFHKYLFTGIIYTIVFALWYFWVRSVRNE